jgi:hypothetical protein
MKMREQALVTHLNITKAGQVRNFQVRLPKNTIQIIGIETSVRLLTGRRDEVPVPLPQPVPFPQPVPVPKQAAAQAAKVIVPIEFAGLMTFRRDTFFGDLRLQSCEQANIFYAKHVQTDENIGMGDYSQSGSWRVLPYTHEGKAEEETVKVNGNSTIIQGIYKDGYVQSRLAYNPDQIKIPVGYVVSVYIWIEIGEAIKEKGGRHDGSTCS